MFAKISQCDKYNALFIALVGICAIGIVVNSTAPLMSGDDIMFYADLKNGEFVRIGWTWREIGRFVPLIAWDFNLISLFTTNPYAFMFIHAFYFIIVAVCFYKLTHRFSSSARVVLFAIFTFSVGAVKSYTQLPYSETLQMTFIMLFFALTRALFSANPHTNLAMNLNSANLKRGGQNGIIKSPLFLQSP